jgi:hypothetical protein
MKILEVLNTAPTISEKVIKKLLEEFCKVAMDVLLECNMGTSKTKKSVPSEGQRSRMMIKTTNMTSPTRKVTRIKPLVAKTMPRALSFLSLHLVGHEDLLLSFLVTKWEH